MKPHITCLMLTSIDGRIPRLARRQRLARRTRDDGGDEQGHRASARRAVLGGASSPLRESRRQNLLDYVRSLERLVVEGGGNVNGSLLAPGVVDELRILIAPAIDGALGITGVFEVPDAKGLAGKVRVRFLSCEALPHGLVDLRYAVEAAAAGGS